MGTPSRLTCRLFLEPTKNLQASESHKSIIMPIVTRRPDIPPHSIFSASCCENISVQRAILASKLPTVATNSRLDLTTISPCIPSGTRYRIRDAVTLASILNPESLCKHYLTCYTYSYRLEHLFPASHVSMQPPSSNAMRYSALALCIICRLQ
jgi:hypothetical protein